jgi:hypothetical protein
LPITSAVWSATCFNVFLARVDFFKQAGYAPLTPDWPDDCRGAYRARAGLAERPDQLPVRPTHL